MGARAEMASFGLYMAGPTVSAPTPVYVFSSAPCITSSPFLPSSYP